MSKLAHVTICFWLVLSYLYAFYHNVSYLISFSDAFRAFFIWLACLYDFQKKSSIHIDFCIFSIFRNIFGKNRKNLKKIKFFKKNSKISKLFLINRNQFSRARRTFFIWSMLFYDLQKTFYEILKFDHFLSKSQAKFCLSQKTLNCCYM